MIDSIVAEHACEAERCALHARTEVDVGRVRLRAPRGAMRVSPSTGNASTKTDVQASPMEANDF